MRSASSFSESWERSSLTRLEVSETEEDFVEGRRVIGVRVIVADVVAGGILVVVGEVR